MSSPPALPGSTNQQPNNQPTNPAFQQVFGQPMNGHPNMIPMNQPDQPMYHQPMQMPHAPQPMHPPMNLAQPFPHQPFPQSSPFGMFPMNPSMQPIQPMYQPAGLSQPMLSPAGFRPTTFVPSADSMPPAMPDNPKKRSSGRPKGPSVRQYTEAIAKMKRGPMSAIDQAKQVKSEQEWSVPVVQPRLPAQRPASDETSGRPRMSGITLPIRHATLPNQRQPATFLPAQMHQMNQVDLSGQPIPIDPSQWNVLHMMNPASSYGVVSSHQSSPASQQSPTSTSPQGQQLQSNIEASTANSSQVMSSPEGAQPSESRNSPTTDPSQYPLQTSDQLSYPMPPFNQPPFNMQSENMYDHDESWMSSPLPVPNVTYPLSPDLMSTANQPTNNQPVNQQMFSQSSAMPTLSQVLSQSSHPSQSLPVQFAQPTDQAPESTPHYVQQTLRAPPLTPLPVSASRRTSQTSSHTSYVAPPVKFMPDARSLQNQATKRAEAQAMLHSKQKAVRDLLRKPIPQHNQVNQQPSDQAINRSTFGHTSDYNSDPATSAREIAVSAMLAQSSTRKSSGRGKMNRTTSTLTNSAGPPPPGQRAVSDNVDELAQAANFQSSSHVNGSAAGSVPNEIDESDALLTLQKLSEGSPPLAQSDDDQPSPNENDDQNEPMTDYVDDPTPATTEPDQQPLNESKIDESKTNEPSTVGSLSIESADAASLKLTIKGKSKSKSLSPTPASQTVDRANSKHESSRDNQSPSYESSDSLTRAPQSSESASVSHTGYLAPAPSKFIPAKSKPSSKQSVHAQPGDSTTDDELLDEMSAAKPEPLPPRSRARAKRKSSTSASRKPKRRQSNNHSTQPQSDENNEMDEDAHVPVGSSPVAHMDHSPSEHDDADHDAAHGDAVNQSVEQSTNQSTKPLPSTSASSSVAPFGASHVDGGSRRTSRRRRVPPVVAETAPQPIIGDEQPVNIDYDEPMPEPDVDAETVDESSSSSAFSSHRHSLPIIDDSIFVDHNTFQLAQARIGQHPVLQRGLSAMKSIARERIAEAQSRLDQAMDASRLGFEAERQTILDEMRDVFAEWQRDVVKSLSEQERTTQHDEDTRKFMDDNLKKRHSDRDTTREKHYKRKFSDKKDEKVKYSLSQRDVEQDINGIKDNIRDEWGWQYVKEFYNTRPDSITVTSRSWTQFITDTASAEVLDENGQIVRAPGPAETHVEQMDDDRNETSQSSNQSNNQSNNQS